MMASRRALLRLKLAPLLRGEPEPGDAIEQAPMPGPGPLPGCSAERGYAEAPPPWATPPAPVEDDHGR